MKNRKTFFLTNSMTGKREEFKPLQPQKASFYSCGLTVYGPGHIGNARQTITADLIYRWLKHIGYDVNFVRNYTDVDDKIIDRAKKEGITAIEVAEKYIAYNDHDYELLGIAKPTHVARVTESIDDIIQMIQKIIDNGHAYVVDGEVFFSIDSFPSYGKLSGKNVDDLIAGARVEVDAKKRNPLDFTLWKPNKPDEPFWESPWGRGRPGWHIECSAMIQRWQGPTIDLHHGGPDLIFPHHENEIAQSEAANGKPFCAHWAHHAFLTMGNQKMSKSLGNLLTTRDFIEAYGAELLKFIYASFHYRSAVPYTEEMMSQALNELERVYLAKKWAAEAVAATPATSAKDEAWKALQGKAAEFFQKMEDELFMDLNTPGALGHLFALIREINRVETQAAGKPGLTAPSSALRREVAREFLSLLEDKLHPLLNLFSEPPVLVLEQIEKARRLRRARSSQGAALPSDDEIRALIQERKEARQAKNFKRGDDIRQQLESQGIQLIDSPTGTTWKIKE